VVISFLMWRDGDNYENTFRLVKEKRGIANPNMGFTCQMLQWNKRRTLEIAPGGGVDRLHRVAPHSQHDPRYLVAKPLTGHSAAHLDARGAFVLQTASGKAYVWVGPKAVDPEFARRGEEFARQLHVYEGLGGGGGGGDGSNAGISGGGRRADGEASSSAAVEMVRGGEEPPEVLAALGLAPTEDGGDAVASERRGDGGGGGWIGAAAAKLAAYDDDFAMYEKGERSLVAAKSGAAVPPPAWAMALTNGGRGDVAGPEPGDDSSGMDDREVCPPARRTYTPGVNSMPPTPKEHFTLQSFALADMSGGSLSSDGDGDGDVSGSAGSSRQSSPAAASRSLGRSSSLPSGSANDLLDGIASPTTAAAAPPRSPSGTRPPPADRLAELLGSLPQNRTLSMDGDDDGDDDSCPESSDNNDDTDGEDSSTSAQAPSPKPPKASEMTTTGAAASSLALSGLGLSVSGGGERGGDRMHGAEVMDTETSAEEPAGATAAATAVPPAAFAYPRPRPPTKPPHMPPPPRRLGVTFGMPTLQSNVHNDEEDAAAVAAAAAAAAAAAVAAVSAAVAGSGSSGVPTLGLGGKSITTHGSGGSSNLDTETQAVTFTSPGSPRGRARAPMLLEYPSLDPIGVYDVDDLEPTGVFILLVAQGGGMGSALYVWIGADAGDELELGDKLDVAGGRIGEECVMKLGVVGGHEVHVEVEGSESADFWTAFEEGN
jgi:hypothetical protein